MTESTSRRYVRSAVLFELLLGLLALIAAPLLGVDPGGWISWPRFGPQLVIGLLATVPLLGLLLGLDGLEWEPLERLRQLVEHFVQTYFGRATIWQLLVVAAAAGLGEEMLFRGLAQTLLARLAPPPAGAWIGCLAGGALFGLAHLVSGTYFVLATLVGVYLGVLYAWTGTLTAPAVAHGLYDAVALWYLTRGPGNRTGRAGAAGPNEAGSLAGKGL